VLSGKYFFQRIASIETSGSTCLMTQHLIPYDFHLHLCCKNMKSYKKWFIYQHCHMSMMYEWMCMEQWWNDTDRGKLKYWEKNIIKCGW